MYVHIFVCVYFNLDITENMLLGRSNILHKRVRIVIKIIMFPTN